MLLRPIQGLAIITAFFSVCLFAVKPNIERFLSLRWPGNPMPDAFKGLNGAIPLFMVFVTASLLLAARICRTHQIVLFIPLMFGPLACFVGWYLTENFSDPSWFDLFALTTIGMLVSCSVTALLSIATNKTTEQSDGHQAADQPL
jgi:hypothetical protein